MAAADLIIAFVIGVYKVYDLIAGVNTATAVQKEKMNLPAMGKVTSVGSAVTGGLCALTGVLSISGIPFCFEIGFMVFIIGTAATALYVQRYDGNNYNENGQPKRRMRILSISVIAICAIVIGFVAWLNIATMSDPTVRFDNNELSIEGFYGLEVNREDVMGVSLYETSPVLTAKTNGVAINGVYKGNFTAKGLGRVLVFANSGISPWICVERKDKAPILICLSSSDSTTNLYKQMEAWLGGAAPEI
jgi:hypothetical protein